MKLSTQNQRPVITRFYDTAWSQHGRNISHLFLRTITIQSCFPTHLIKRELHDKSLTLGVRDQGSWRAEDHGSLLEAWFIVKHVTLSVADLHSKILDARPPWGSKFFQFHAVFGKIWQNRMLAPPPLESWRPLLGEILDPPLLVTLTPKR